MLAGRQPQCHSTVTPIYFHQHMLSALHDKLCLLFACLRVSFQQPRPLDTEFLTCVAVMCDNCATHSLRNTKGNAVDIVVTLCTLQYLQCSRKKKELRK